MDIASSLNRVLNKERYTNNVDYTNIYINNIIRPFQTVGIQIKCIKYHYPLSIGSIDCINSQEQRNATGSEWFRRFELHQVLFQIATHCSSFKPPPLTSSDLFDSI